MFGSLNKNVGLNHQSLSIVVSLIVTISAALKDYWFCPNCIIGRKIYNKRGKFFYLIICTYIFYIVEGAKI